MTTRTRCRLCDRAITYRSRSFTWRHDSTPEWDHAPIPRKFEGPAATQVREPGGYDRRAVQHGRGTDKPHNQRHPNSSTED